MSNSDENPKKAPSLATLTPQHRLAPYTIYRIKDIHK